MIIQKVISIVYGIRIYNDIVQKIQAHELFGDPDIDVEERLIPTTVNHPVSSII